MGVYGKRNDARTNTDQSDLDVIFRVSFESQTPGLYVIRIPDGPCKIGRTIDLPTRLSKMQCHHPYTLEVVGWLPGREHEELAWHHCFDDYRLRGEWFEWVPAIKLAIEIASEGGDWTEVAEPPSEIFEEVPNISVRDAKALYRALLRRWADERRCGVKEARLPPRANTKPVPVGSGPIAKSRLESLNA